MGISKDLTEEDVKFRYINEAITRRDGQRIVSMPIAKDDTAYLGDRCECRRIVKCGTLSHKFEIDIKR